MIEHELKFYVPPQYLREPLINSEPYLWAAPMITGVRHVTQTDSYRINDTYGNAIMRLRAHEAEGDVILGYKENAVSSDGLMSRIEKEHAIATGLKPQETHFMARAMMADYPEFAHTSIRRALIDLERDGNVCHMTIDIGFIHTPTQRKAAVISEVELELHKGSLKWLRDLGEELRGHMYETTGEILRPSESKGYIAKVAAEVIRSRRPDFFNQQSRCCL